MSHKKDQAPSYFTFVALFAGFLLASMMHFNGALARASEPVAASLGIHLIGTVAALGLMLCWKTKQPIQILTTPWWAYLAGVFGGITVVIVGITVNSPLGIAGTVALFLLGQIFYGWVNDSFGLFGFPKRKIKGLELLQALLVLAGSALIIFG
jgi:transporter family-2 protein